MKVLNYFLIGMLTILLVVLLMVSCGGLAYADELPGTKFFTDDETDMVAKTVWGEARGCSDIQQEAVVWCILNRVDDERFPDTIAGVITQPNEFFGYAESNPVEEEIRETARKVLLVWATEEIMPADGLERVLPREYVFFSGNGRENTFTTAYNAGNVWDLSQYERRDESDLPQVYGVC